MMIVLPVLVLFGATVAFAKPLPTAQLGGGTIAGATRLLGQPVRKGNDRQGSPFQYRWTGTKSVDLYAFGGKVLIVEAKFAAGVSQDEAFKRMGMNRASGSPRPNHLRNDLMSYVNVKGAPKGWIVAVFEEKRGGLMVQVADPSSP